MSIEEIVGADVRTVSAAAKCKHVHEPVKVKKAGLHEVVSGPLGEERDRDHDPEATPVTRGLEEARPSYVRCNLLVEPDSRPDLLKLVLDESVGPAQS